MKPWMLGPFLRPEPVQPILEPNANTLFDCPMVGRPVAWQKDHVFNPAAVVRNGRVFLLYRAEDDSGEGIGAHTSRIGLAESADGIHFTAQPTPVLFPAQDNAKPYEWPGGCEDPRIVETDHGYVLTYTGWDRKTPRLEVATSPDLTHWTKHGPAFEGPLQNEPSKSGSIVTRRIGDHLVAVQIQGRYWMYWGEGTTMAATSTDLVHWDAVLDAAGKPAIVIAPRPGHFDSGLTEPGPPAVLTKNGIVLIYNGKNADDPEIPSGAYSAGQVLLDPSDPSKVVDRSEKPFFEPEQPYEQSGQYRAGTVFVEGLVHFDRRWFLYYGAADSVIGCAVAGRG
jgi:predicted GH43/DUF377 family glycosyl hydrolase